ncbi:MAG: LptF/LptG family permease [Fibrobacterota bacterium]
MKVIVKYILRRFLGLLAGNMGGMLAVFLIIDYVSNIGKFNNATSTDVLTYYLYYTPYVIVLVFPIAMLLSTMFCVGITAKNNELTALRSAGVSVWKVLMPLVFLAFFISLGVLVFNNYLMPYFNRERVYIDNAVIQEKEKFIEGERRRNVLHRGKKNILYRIGDFRPSNKTGRNVKIYFFLGNRLYMSAEADHMRWEDGRWVLLKSVTRTVKGTNVDIEKHTTYTHPFLIDKPEDFSNIKRKAEEMDLAELSEYIDLLKRSGAGEKNIKHMQTELHFKMSLPFINFVVVLIGVGIASGMGGRGMSLMFGLGIFMALFYYIVVQIGRVLGQSVILGPFVGAWFGNLIFLPIGILIFLRAIK